MHKYYIKCIIRSWLLYTEFELLTYFIISELLGIPEIHCLIICVSMGHAYFSNDKISISWVPVMPSTVFLGCRMSEVSKESLPGNLWTVAMLGFQLGKRNTP